MSKVSEKYDLSYTQNREISWLRFNSRVLEEATDENVPLLERLRFISIFTSNLDEFFMVRVGSLYDLNIMTPKHRDNKSGQTPGEQLNNIFEAVRPMIARRDSIYSEVSEKLSKKGVCDISYDQLFGSEKEYVRNYYKTHIAPLLSPQIVDFNHPFPHLKNKSLYIATVIRNKKENSLGILEVPDTIPKIIFLPGSNSNFIRTENLILHNIDKIFQIYNIVEKCVISVTRNADISYDDEKFDEDNPDFRNYMKKLLKRRERLNPVRLEMQGKAPILKKMLLARLKLNENQCYTCDCPLAMGYAYQIEKCDESLYYSPYKPIYPLYLEESVPMWKQIKQRDILLFYPYHSMKPFLDLLKQSATDPNVLSIKITIYRLAKNSAIVKHLCSAAENGKEVTILMELRARFDEQNNIEWTKILEEAGCKVIYGPEDYKCHSKICLITRRDKNGIKYITQIGTGNYNEKTSAIYTDFSLLTSNESIANDAVNFFKNMLIGNLYGHYNTLLVAPVSLKNTIERLIDGEIARGNKGHIIIKANSVTERDLIDKLKEASCAGVKVELIIRGICCILPSIPSKTENITVTSVVGRFLEHSRIYSFGDGELNQMYISSADIMTRNQTRRVEVACPIMNDEIKKWLSSYLQLLLKDNTKARRMISNGEYIGLFSEDNDTVNAQQYYLKNPIMFTKTKLKRQPLFKKLINKFRHTK